MIGGCDDKIKQDFTTLLMSVRDDCLKSKRDPSDSPSICLMHDLIAAIKLIEVKWSVPEDKTYDKNEPFIDIVVARHHQDNLYLFTGNKRRFSCVILSCNLNHVDANSQQSTLLLTGAQFCVPTNLSDNFREGIVLFFFSINIFIR
jgi:hypothetical protein